MFSFPSSDRFIRRAVASARFHGAVVALGVFLVGAPQAARAQNSLSSFTGTIANDNSIALRTVTVGQNSLVTIRTWGYAGGVNGSGATIARGGFDPLVSLFNNTGTLLIDNDDDLTGVVAPDAVTGGAYDALAQAVVGPGTYTIALTQYLNAATGPNLSNGFLFDGAANTNYTNGPFRDGDSNIRTNAWAFDVRVVAVPEPGTAGLLALPLTVAVVARRRRKKA